MLPNLTVVIILLHTHASDNHIVHLLCTVFSGKMSVGSSAHFAESGCFLGIFVVSAVYAFWLVTLCLSHHLQTHSFTQ